MKIRYMATLLATGAAAAAIAAAPGAMAAPITDITATGSTITQRDGHVHIDASPDAVSPPRSYGQFSSPAPFMFFD